MATRVGFIGLGVMGRPMAHNLLTGGADLLVHSRSAGPVDELTRAGAGAAASPSELAAASDVIILMLPDDAAVETVVFGDSGVLESLRDGALLIDMSTVSPGLDQRVARGRGPVRRRDARCTGERRRCRRQGRNTIDHGRWLGRGV